MLSLIFNLEYLLLLIISYLRIILSELWDSKSYMRVGSSHWLGGCWIMSFSATRLLGKSRAKIKSAIIESP